MRAVIQRVSEATVKVNGEIAGRIGAGQVVLLGISRNDTEADAAYLARKVAGLRIFDDNDGKMNCTLQDVGGAILVVSQFTLYGDVSKGSRPSFTEAAPAEGARHLYDRFIDHLRKSGIPVETGIFKANMKVSLINDGPVTILCESVKIDQRG